MVISPIIKLLFWLGLLFVSVYYFTNLMAHPFKRRRHIAKRGEKATAVIIDYKIETGADGTKYYHPVLEFKDKAGKRIVVEAEVGKTSWYKGDKQIEIYYLAEDPYQFYIIDSAPGEVFLLPIGIIAIGLIVFAIVRTILALG